MITYIGNGVWTDSVGKKWTNGTSEEFEVDTDATEFLSDRRDLGYMVRYGAMRINSMSIGAPVSPDQLKNQGDTKKTSGDASETPPTNAGEGKPEDGVKKITIVNTK